MSILYILFVVVAMIIVGRSRSAAKRRENEDRVPMTTGDLPDEERMQPGQPEYFTYDSVAGDKKHSPRATLNYVDKKTPKKGVSDHTDAAGENGSHDEGSVVDDIDGRKLIIYAEILKPKYKEY